MSVDDEGQDNNNGTFKFFFALSQLVEHFSFFNSHLILSIRLSIADMVKAICTFLGDPNVILA